MICGSFANVCIYRLPKNKSIVTGRSSCPNCKKKIIWYDNIPLLSFILLKSKCRFCKKLINLQSQDVIIDIGNIGKLDNTRGRGGREGKNENNLHFI